VSHGQTTFPHSRSRTQKISPSKTSNPSCHERVNCGSNGGRRGTRCGKSRWERDDPDSRIGVMKNHQAGQCSTSTTALTPIPKSRDKLEGANPRPPTHEFSLVEKMRGHWATIHTEVDLITDSPLLKAPDEPIQQYPESSASRVWIRLIGRSGCCMVHPPST
jgi:hypothetical protein